MADQTKIKDLEEDKDNGKTVINKSSLDDEETVLSSFATAPEDDRTILSTETSETPAEKTKIDTQMDEDEATQILKKPATETDSIHSMDQEPTVYPGGVLKNRFDLLEMVGQGGMGAVYKALDKRDVEAGNTKFIAIKIINDQYKTDSNLLKALHAETRKTQSLAHPNIVTVYDFDRDENTVFMTMEYIEGIPLNQVIKSKPRGLKIDQVIQLINQIGSALVYAHSQHIIHLDLKPSNIFIDAKNHVKIFDFGISRVANIFQAKGFDAGILGGLTPSYASLEMFRGDAPDPRDDVYALACISYELLTGHHPYNREQADIAQKKKLKAKRINKLSIIQWNTLAQALAFNRRDRIESVELFLQGMSMEKSKKSLAISGVILAGLLALSYYLYSQYSDSTAPVDDKLSTIEKPDQAKVLTKKPEEMEKQPTDIATPESPSAEKTIKQEIPLLEENEAISFTTNQQVFQIGDKLVVEFMVKKPMYVSIAIINSEGKVSMLFPNPFQSNNFCMAGVKYQVPPLVADFNINIEAPVGTDQLIAVMGDQAIAEDLLTQFDSLEQLKNKISQLGFSYAMTSYQITD